MNNCFKAAFLMLLSTVLFSCATIFTGTHSNTTFDSFPQDATVKINGEVVGRTPVKVKVSKKLFKIKTVEISKEGYATQQHLLKRTLNPIALLDIMFFLGIPVDILSGAVIQYESKYYNTRLVPSDTSQWGEYKINSGNALHIWNKKVRLTWDFFKGLPEKLKVDKLIQTAAVTSSWFPFVYSFNDRVINLYSFAVFNTEGSWVIHRSKKNLNHEQRHFDISEIYSRKFKRKIIEQNFRNKNIDTVLTEIYDDYEKKLMAAQNKYDTETNHGMNAEMQNTWDQMIDKELNETITFGNPYYQITLTN